MKKELTILLLAILILTPLLLAEEESTLNKDTLEKAKESAKAQAEASKWNESVALSPTWQTITSTFFGLNLYEKTEKQLTTVREAVIFLMIFLMFLVLVIDIIKITPFLKGTIAGIPTSFLVALAITLITSIAGGFIGLKNLIIAWVTFIVEKLDWEWVRKGGTFLTSVFITLVIIAIHELLSWAKPVVKKHALISKAKARGRQIREITNANSQE